MGLVEGDLLVPGVDEAARSQRLTNADPLLLSSTHTPNGLVPDTCPHDMSQSKNRRVHIRNNVHEILPRPAVDPCVRCTAGCGEFDGLLDGEGGEVDVVFRAVLDVTSVVRGDGVGGEGVVGDGAVEGVVFGALVG
jgi:hypothetical protein